MSVTLTRFTNTQQSLRLQLEQMLNPEPPVSEYASSASESVADSFDGENLTQSQYDQGKSGPLGDESDGEADPDWAAQIMDIEIDVQDDQQSEGKSISEIHDESRALVLRAYAK
jgi:hypothetical protein